MRFERSSIYRHHTDEAVALRWPGAAEDMLSPQDVVFRFSSMIRSWRGRVVSFLATLNRVRQFNIADDPANDRSCSSWRAEPWLRAQLQVLHHQVTAASDAWSLPVAWCRCRAGPVGCRQLKSDSSKPPSAHRHATAQTVPQRALRLK